MATQIGYAVGSAFGPVGGFVGAAIGGFIDSKIFGGDPDTPDGPRLDDLTVTSANFGVPIPLVFGPKNRVGGTIVWSTDLVETQNKDDSGGGKGGGGSDSSQTTYTYHVSCAVAISGRPIKQVQRIWANNKVIFDLDGDSGVSPTEDIEALDPVEGGTYTIDSGAQVTIYPGSGTQQADTFIQGFEGADTPTYRHVSYVVIKTLQLADFGNRIPNFEFEIVADDALTIGALLEDLTDRSGISITSVAHMATPGDENDILGYFIARQSRAYEVIQPLSAAYNFDVSEQFGQVRYVRRQRSMLGSIPQDRMGASSGSKITSPIREETTTPKELPSEVSVSYSDPDMDYQRNSQTEFRRVGAARNKIMIEVPAVITSNFARQLAEKMLWAAWSRRQKAVFSVDSSWIRLSPGNMIGIQSGGETIPAIITRKEIGNDGIINIEVQYDPNYSYVSDAAGVAGPVIRQTYVAPGISEAALIDGPMLQDSDKQDGFYWATSGASTNWRGTSLFRSTDSEVTYNNIDANSLRSKIGYVTGIVPSAQTEVFDEGTISVTMVSSITQLSSVTELDIYNGENVAWLGPRFGGIGEVIQFKTATLVGENQYTLTDLLRGRLGTEHAVGSHTSDDVLVVLERGIIRSQGFGVSDWDIARDYKAVTNTTALAATPNIDFTHTGVRSKPLSPVHPLGNRDVSDNLTISWVRRSRAQSPGLGNGDPALFEATESYEIDVFNSVGAIVRTITSTTESATYSAANQTTDGFTVPELIQVKIYQISETRGRGYAADAVL